jgi:hypothetical protein
MRRILPLVALGFASVVSACKAGDEILSQPVIPTAGVRFINAVPDTGAAFGFDFRFVDIVENSSAFRQTFRDNPQTTAGVTSGTGTYYKPAQAGARQIRIFLDDTLQAAAQTVLKDTTVTLTASHNYTGLMQGNARSTGSDKMRFSFIDETVDDPGSQIALRVINTTSSAIDVRVYASGGTPGSVTFANVPAFGMSAYVKFAPGQYLYNVQPAGGGTALFTDALALLGQPPGTSTNGGTVGLDLDVTPGTLVAGSAVSGVVYPRSVAGSKAANFTTPGITFSWDRRPARNCTVSFGC